MRIRVECTPLLIGLGVALASHPRLFADGGQAARGTPPSSEVHSDHLTGDPGVPRPEISSAEYYALGKQDLARGEVGRAIRQLSQAVAKQPDRVEYSVALSDAYVAAGDRGSAERLLALLARRFPDSVPIHRRLADAGANAGDFKKAAAALAAVEEHLDAPDLERLVQYQQRCGEVRLARETLERAVRNHRQHLPFWLAWIDEAVGRNQYSTALQRVETARACHPLAPALGYRAAVAHLALGKGLGDAVVRRVEKGQPGQFVDGWLLVESRGGDRFLCCPSESALFQLRLALDAGFDDPAAHVLHARVWQAARRPAVGLALLRSREAALLDPPREDVLTALAELALDVNELEEFLRYARLRAGIARAGADAELHKAYLAAAERYAARGDDVLFTECLRQASRLAPDDARLKVRLGDAEWDLGRQEAARIAYQTALATLPTVDPDRERLLERLFDVRAETDR